MEKSTKTANEIRQMIVGELRSRGIVVSKGVETGRATGAKSWRLAAGRSTAAGHRSIKTTQGYIEGDYDCQRRLVRMLLRRLSLVVDVLFAGFSHFAWPERA
jgi:hypothetical protein